jgi:hypothetical protein
MIEIFVFDMVKGEIFIGELGIIWKYTKSENGDESFDNI